MASGMMSGVMSPRRDELTDDEVLAECGGELPERALMRRRRGKSGALVQVIVNPQIVVAGGDIVGPVSQTGANGNR